MKAPSWWKAPISSRPASPPAAARRSCSCRPSAPRELAGALGRAVARSTAPGRRAAARRLPRDRPRGGAHLHPRDAARRAWPSSRCRRAPAARRAARPGPAAPSGRAAAPGGDERREPRAPLLVVYADGVAGSRATWARCCGRRSPSAPPPSSRRRARADLYGPKTVRASMGAVFGLPLFAGGRARRGRAAPGAGARVRAGGARRRAAAATPAAPPGRAVRRRRAPRPLRPPARLVTDAAHHPPGGRRGRTPSSRSTPASPAPSPCTSSRAAAQAAPRPPRRPPQPEKG